MRRPFLVLVLAHALPSAGCSRPAAGDPCGAISLMCSGPSSSLFCGPDDRLVSQPCAGPGGCDAPTRSCDNTLAAAGASCADEGDEACTADQKVALTCVGHKFVVDETCGGPSGCRPYPDHVTCDNDVAAASDACRFEGDYACTADHGYLLQCRRRSMVVVNSCRGPKGCKIAEVPDQRRVDFTCDDSVAHTGDPCDTEGEEACSADGRSLFVCERRKFVSSKLLACGAPGCTHDDVHDTYACDTTVAVSNPQAPSLPHSGR